MNLIVSLEHHFGQTPDGTVWTQVAYASRFWQRYLQVFDQVRVIARVAQVTQLPPGWVRADDANISFVGLPDYNGPLQYLAHAREITARVRRAFQPGDAFILRVPSAIASIVVSMLAAQRYPYALQVVGDPFDVFAPGAVTHPLRIFWRRWFAHQLKRQCAEALAVAYVTGQYLQRRYPCPAYTTSFSDVELGADAFVPTPRDMSRTDGAFRLITIASLAQPYKAIDVLVQAMALCGREGLDAELVVVGDGRYRSQLEAQSQDLGLQSRIHFLGQLPAGAPVRFELDRSDCFVLPSRVEGLPRAMLEAMARGLPCIGSTAGGIHELLAPEDMVPPGNARALANKILEVAGDTARRASMARRNLAGAEAYRMEKLAVAQCAFYHHVRERTEVWLTAQ